MQKSIDVDRALIDDDDERLRDVDLPIVQAATQHDANTLYRLQTVPGIGKLLRLVRLYDSYDSNRCPRGQEFASSGRLVTCAKASHGQRAGSSGTNIGNAPLKGAFAEAAVFFRRAHPAGQQRLARFEKKHGQGKAFASLAHQLARAGYDMVKRKVAVDLHRFLHDCGRGGGELDASLDTTGGTSDVQRSCMHQSRRL